MEQKGNKSKPIHLQNQILQCRSCQNVFGFKPHSTVQKNYGAKAIQIGQAPPKSVHETGRPFNDTSGRRLRGEWYRTSDEDFHNPDHFYIVSMTHCCPSKALDGEDRRPLKVCSEQWLLRKMKFVGNNICTIIGGVAAESFSPREKVIALAFEDKQTNGKPAYVLPHPSPLSMR